jgi:cysteine desulfurase
LILSFNNGNLNSCLMSELPTIYLDHAATAPIDPRVKDAMLPYLGEEFGNASSLHSTGRRAKEALDDARDTVSKILHCRAEEIVFTSGGTEADNLAILGIARAYKDKGNRIITSTVEHHAVLHAFEHLFKKEGTDAVYITVGRDGLVNPAEISAALTDKTVLISIMYANNEIGTIEPVADIAKAIAEWKKANNRKPLDLPFFHVDACQAAGALPLDVAKLGCDLMTVNGSKVYGPKGAGFLYIRSGVRPEPLMYGGAQEWGVRPGTENIAAIVGLAKALEIAEASKEKENARLVALRDKLIAGMLAIPKTILNGHPALRLPNNANVSIMDIEGEAMVLYLDEAGFRVSTGSACTSANLEPSHVIRALGLPYEAAHGSLRVSLGRGTTEDDIDKFLKVLPPIVEKLRKLSPVRLNMKHYA